MIDKTKTRFRHLKIILFCLIIVVLMTLSYFVIVSIKILEEMDEGPYSIRIRLENRTDQDMFVIIFPVVTSSGKVIEVSSRSELSWRIVGAVTSTGKLTRQSISVPLVLSSAEAIERCSVEQVRLEKKSYEFVTYYLGKEVDLENLAICTIAWQLPSETGSAVFQEEPYLVRTFYDPEFEVGPEHYGIFAHLIIE